MHSELIYYAQKAIIEERIQRAAQPQPPRPARRTVSRRRRARRAIAAAVHVFVV